MIVGAILFFAGFLAGFLLGGSGGQTTVEIVQKEKDSGNKDRL
jgi:hypothetical protein